MLSAQKVAETSIKMRKLIEEEAIKAIETTFDSKINEASNRGEFSTIVTYSDFMDSTKSSNNKFPVKILDSMIYNYKSNGFKIEKEPSFSEKSDDGDFVNISDLQIHISWKEEIENSYL